MKHDPSKCSLCGDFQDGSIPEHATYDEVFLHLVARMHELEARLRETEWRDTPIGPGPDGNYGQGNLEEERAEAIRKILGEPECAICFDEEGSYACLRMSHEARKKRGE